MLDGAGETWRFRSLYQSASSQKCQDYTSHANGILAVFHVTCKWYTRHLRRSGEGRPDAYKEMNPWAVLFAQNGFYLSDRGGLFAAVACSGFCGFCFFGCEEKKFIISYVLWTTLLASCILLRACKESASVSRGWGRGRISNLFLHK
jgi:hypothetical protein